MTIAAKSPLDVAAGGVVDTLVRGRGAVRARHHRLLVTGLVLADALAVGLAVLGWHVSVPRADGTDVLVALPVLWVGLMAVTGWYSPIARPASLVRNAMLLGIAGWALAGALGRQLPIEALAAVATTSAIVSRSHRGLLGAWAVRRGVELPGRTRHAVVVGHAGAVTRLIRDVAVSRGVRDLRFAGVCLLDHDDPDAPGLPEGLQLAVDIEQLQDLVDSSGADTVIVLPCSHLDSTTLRRIGWDMERRGTGFLVAPALTGVAAARARVASTGGLAMLDVQPARLCGPCRLVKEAWERTAAALALLVLSPVLGLLMLAVRLDSPGPAIFRQTRVGKDDRCFAMWKLRTMTVDAEDRREELHTHNEVDGNLFKIREDPRVTRLGRILRRTSLDELPQLVNVVRGQMSLVGPRPALPAEVAAYERDVRRRLVVKPGITGLWQVSGRSDLTWEDAVRLDQSYVDNWSLRLDLAILARTFGAVLDQRGAY